MHRCRPVLALLTAVAAALLLLAGPAAAAGVREVALGDSYSSGVGAGDYISASGECDRSPNAYSALWAAAHSRAAYTSVACSGATTSDVESSRLSALSSTTTLVSITFGGNDENFSSIMEDCNLDAPTPASARSTRPRPMPARTSAARSTRSSTASPPLAALGERHRVRRVVPPDRRRAQPGLPADIHRGCLIHPREWSVPP